MRECPNGVYRWIWIVALSVLVSAGAAHGAAPCRFFVRAGFVPAEGDPDGRSPERAFSTIAAGVAAASNAGDVVCVGPGLYVEGDITLAADVGTPNDPVEIRGDASGASTNDPAGSVRIVPPNDLPPGEIPGTAFLILGRHDVIIEGFEIAGFRDAGIQVRSGVTLAAANSADITIRGNAIRDCRTGIDVNAEGMAVVEGNTIVGSVESGISVQACTVSSEFGVCRGVIGEPVVPIVSNNRVGGSGAHGIFVRVSDGGVIQNNVVYANAFTGITLRGATGALVANNLVYANGEEGLAVGSGFFSPGDGTDPAEFASPGVVAVHNTLYGNGEWGLEVGNTLAASPGGLVANNIVWRNGLGSTGIGVLNESQFDSISGALLRRAPSTCGYVAGFNLVDNYGPDTPRNTYDLDTDPRFVDVEGADGVVGGERVDGVFLDRSADDDFRPPATAAATRASPISGSTTAPAPSRCCACALPSCRCTFASAATIRTTA